MQPTINKVGIIKDKPPRPNTKPIPGLSNNPAVNRKETTNNGIVIFKKRKSCLRNGRVKIKIPIGNTKNCIPPHDANPKPKTIPPPITLRKAIF